jgi:ABC-2 type transport system ATP-binding protein
VASGETFLPDFVREFPQRLLSVGLRRPTLEDVFLALTGHEIRDSELDAKEMLLAGMGRWGR